ncbi:MAG TPA: hypothetical protein P5205_13740 [Candidatus Paceibacterota bacterium]|nr:hypothetical protein [Verrucomicrobiota bacterium]HSA11423.1 hypothetical protein [Candidatus Paceibacterota bacterium]
MKARALSAFLAFSCLITVSGQSTVAYFSGPSFQVPLEFATAIDLNQDAAADFSFWSTRPLITTDYPSSGGAWPYCVGALGTNQMLITGYDALLQPFGAEIGSDAPPTSGWATPPWWGAGLAAYWWSRYGAIIGDQIVYSGWSGPLGNLGVAYMGVRVCSTGGPRYGWVRVRLPRPYAGPGINLFEYAVTVVDWAYETCPDKPIRAGDIGSAGESVQFTVEWSSPRHEAGSANPEVGTGSFILTGNTLRGELDLAGQFTSAHIVGPGNPRQRSEPLSDFGQPLVSNVGRTAFFSEVTLTSSQVKHLFQGKYSVTVDSGGLTGRIEPVVPVHRTGRHSANSARAPREGCAVSPRPQPHGLLGQRVTPPVPGKRR